MLVRGDLRGRAVGHQARARVLHDQPARLHVHGGRDARLRGRDVLPRRARVLQGADVPGRRLRDPRRCTRSRTCAQMGGLRTADADHLRDVPRRRARRRPAMPPLAGFFAKDAVLEVAEPHRAPGRLRARHARRVRLRLLHRPDAVPHVLRPAAERRRGARPRVARGCMLDAARDPRRRRGRRRDPRTCRPRAVLGALARSPWSARSPRASGLSVPSALRRSPSPIAVVGARSSRGGSTASGRVDWMAFRARLEPLPRGRCCTGWYVDRAYDLVVVQPAKGLARLTAFVVDARIIDGAVNAIGGACDAPRRPRRASCRTGFVRTYALRGLPRRGRGARRYVGLR